MKILIIGTGVIGTIYGWALSDAGHDITHFVRSEKLNNFNNGILIDIADTRKGKKKRYKVNYSIKVIDINTLNDSFELIIVPVKAYQLTSVLSLLTDKIAHADFLIMTGNWHGTANVDKILPQTRYIWGDTTVGGTYKNGTLIAGIFTPVPLGEINGEKSKRIEKISELFKSAGFKPEVHNNIIHAHWLQYALNAAMWSNFAASDNIKKLLKNSKAIDNTLYSISEAFDICIKRGVDINKFPELKGYYKPSSFKRFLMRWMFRYLFTFNEVVKRTSIEHAVNGADELEIIYKDILNSSKELNVPIPHIESLKDKVEIFIQKHMGHNNPGT